MAGLASPPLRLSHLALGLALHLDAAPAHNPAALVVRGYRRVAADLPLPSQLPPSFPLLSQLAFLPLHRDFLAQRSDAISNNLPAPSRHSFTRQSTLSSFSSRSLILNSYILPSSRPNGLVDGVLRIFDAQDYRRARQWRASTYPGHLRCLVCGRVFSRGHASHMWLTVGAFDEDGPVDDERLQPARERVEAIRQERAEQGVANGSFDLLDFLLGHKRADLAEIGYVTLRHWERRMEEFAAILSSLD
ncbi:hypothetical protein JCM6882_000160 [Rhodosporidiobolus microsporus]